METKVIFPRWKKKREKWQTSARKFFSILRSFSVGVTFQFTRGFQFTFKLNTLAGWKSITLSLFPNLFRNLGYVYFYTGIIIDVHSAKNYYQSFKIIFHDTMLVTLYTCYTVLLYCLHCYIM